MPLQCKSRDIIFNRAGRLFLYESSGTLWRFPEIMARTGHITLVIGGARSGKSSFAERLAADTGLERHYVASAQAYDEEMRQRILRHQEMRGEGWQTHEVPVSLASHLPDIETSQRVILIDCLTLWLTNLMMGDCDIEVEGAALVQALKNSPARIIVVTNEVGLGIVPENAMARAFRDHAGRLHQAVAGIADEVFFIAAGLPLKMKG